MCPDALVVESPWSSRCFARARARSSRIAAPQLGMAVDRAAIVAGDPRYRRCVSRKRGRTKRSARVNEEPLVRNAKATITTAERMLALDLAGVPLTRTTQVVVGWMRSTFEQARVIATLALSDLSHAAAPNRRSLAEAVVRLQWLHGMPQEDRACAVDTLIEGDRAHTRKANQSLSDMGYESTADLTAMEALVLNFSERGRLGETARNFVEAVKSTQGQSLGLYYAWREETQYTHATSVLAVAHAPEREGRIGTGRPPVADPDLQTLWLVMSLVVALVYRLLIQDRVSEEVAMVVVDAFLEAT